LTAKVWKPSQQDTHLYGVGTYSNEEMGLISMNRLQGMHRATQDLQSVVCLLPAVTWSGVLAFQCARLWPLYIKHMAVCWYHSWTV